MSTSRLGKRFALLLLMILLSACGESPAGQAGLTPAPRGRILLWHTWTGAAAPVLERLIAGYEALHPGVDVISVGVDAADVVATFSSHSRNGLAPDLLLADAGAVHDLAQAGLIQDLSRRDDVDTARYLAAALAMVADGEHLYGLPFAGHTQVLFFNRAHVDLPPGDIFALVERSGRGETVAMPTGFEQSFWGIGAYDGAILDADRRLALGLGGFANWLDALQVARTMPGFLLSEDAVVLRQAFVDGKATYYVGDSTELPGLAAAMGKDKVGVAALPVGPNGSAARPLLYGDALVLAALPVRPRPCWRSTWPRR